jgi:GntR family transcriptional regulator
LDALSREIRLDFRSGEPLYLQIVRQIEQLVVKGSLKMGDQLPTVRELATELRINFNTVARAYRVLDENRLISTQRGRGTYIWEEPSEETMKQIRKISLEELTINYVKEIQRLGYTNTDALNEVNRIFLAGNLDLTAKNIENEDIENSREK